MSSQSDEDGRWYTLGLALVQEGFETPRLIDNELRGRLQRVIAYMDEAAGGPCVGRCEIELGRRVEPCETCPMSSERSPT